MSGYEKPPGAPTFWQVIPDNGYILHAVRAGWTNALGFEVHRERYGFWGNLVNGPTACKKVRGRDAQCFPSLRLQFKREWDTGADTAGVYTPETAKLREPKEFTRSWGDFDASLWKGDDRTGAKRICGECATAVMRAWEAHRNDSMGLD